MENSKKLEWTKIEVRGGMESKPSSVPKQTILLDDYLLCFSEKQEIYVFDLVNSEWRTITPKNSNSISLQNTPIHITDQSSLIAFKHNFNQYNSYTNTSLYSLVIDKTQVPWALEWLTPKKLENFRYRTSYSCQPYKKSLYIFGGKESNAYAQDELLIFDPKTCTYLQTNPTIKPNKRHDHSSLIHNDKLFIYGGINETKAYLSDIWAWKFKDHTWECIFSNERFVVGLNPSLTNLSLTQGFGNTLFMLQKDLKGKYFILLSYNLVSRSWTEHREFHEMVDSFILHNTSFIMGKNCDFYKADLSDKRSLIMSKNESLKEVLNDYEQIFNEKLFCDVTFKVEGEEIPAHKAILAQRSDYFYKMFTSQMRESQSEIIEVMDVKKDIFKALIKYVYCGDTDITNDNALDLLILSDEYQLDELKNKCETFLIYNIKPESAVDIINAADKYEAFTLRKTVLQYIITNITTIKKVDKMSRLTESVLCDLIDREAS